MAPMMAHTAGLSVSIEDDEASQSYLMRHVSGAQNPERIQALVLRAQILSDYLD